MFKVNDTVICINEKLTSAWDSAKISLNRKYKIICFDGYDNTPAFVDDNQTVRIANHHVFDGCLRLTKKVKFHK